VSPTGTSMVSGLKRVFFMTTSTVVVWPVDTLSADAPPLAIPAAAGSMAIPRDTARSRAPTAVMVAPVRRGGAAAICGAGGAVASVAWRSRRFCRSARGIRTRKEASVPTTSSETVTFTRLGTGIR